MILDLVQDFTVPTLTTDILGRFPYDGGSDLLVTLLFCKGGTLTRSRHRLGMPAGSICEVSNLRAVR
jgi:hypothetical protein